MKKITAEEAAAIAKKPVGRITEARALYVEHEAGRIYFHHPCRMEMEK